jgi:hypothetical protein
MVHRHNTKIGTILQTHVTISWILVSKLTGIFSLRRMAKMLVMDLQERLAAKAQCISSAIIDSAYKLFVWGSAKYSWNCF